MDDILLAQKQGADFATLVHMLAKHLNLEGRDWAKTVDTASEYVSYCSNPSLLDEHRESLDWTMLLFFVLNNSVSTYEGGAKHVPILTQIEEILRDGLVHSSCNLFFCLAILLRNSITLGGYTWVLPPMIEAFKRFHERMTMEFCSGQRPDTNLTDYIQLRRTTIATFWWRDILVCFLRVRVDYDEITTNAIADAVWLGNDIRSIHRDESNVLDFISEDELIQRLEDTYTVLAESFRTISALHREVVCLIVVGTTAIYPAMDKYGGTRYASDTPIAARAQAIQIRCGLLLVSHAPALKDLPLIHDALVEWKKPLDCPSRLIQHVSPYGKRRTDFGFAIDRLEVVRGVAALDQATGKVEAVTLVDELIAIAKVFWFVKHSPSMDTRFGSFLEQNLERAKWIKGMICGQDSPKNLGQSSKTLPMMYALAVLFPSEYFFDFERAFVASDVDEAGFCTLCDCFSVLLEMDTMIPKSKLEEFMHKLVLLLRHLVGSLSTESSSLKTHQFWAAMGSIARLLLSADENLTGFLEPLRNLLGESFRVGECLATFRITQGAYQSVVDMALVKLYLEVDFNREVVCLNGLLSTSRIVCEPLWGYRTANCTANRNVLLCCNMYTTLVASAIVNAYSQEGTGANSPSAEHHHLHRSNRGRRAAPCSRRTFKVLQTRHAY